MDDIIPQDDTPRKKCSKCKNFFPAMIEFFARDRSRKDGLNATCKACCIIRDTHKRDLRNSERIRRGPRKKRKIINIPEGMKQCSKCEALSPATLAFFSSDCHKKDGLYTICKECHKMRNTQKTPLPKKLTQPRKKAVRPRKEPTQSQPHKKTVNTCDIPEGMKHCSKCGKDFPATPEFFKRDKHKIDGLYSSCKTCWKETRDVEKDRERGKQAYRQHRERYREYTRQYLKTEQGKAAHLEGSLRHRMRKKAVEGVLTAQQIQDKLKAQNYCCYYAACDFSKFPKVKGKYIYEIEHTIPISRTEANPRNDVNYVVLSCKSCNNKKRTKLPHEFFEGGRLF